MDVPATSSTFPTYAAAARVAAQLTNPDPTMTKKKTDDGSQAAGVEGDSEGLKHNAFSFKCNSTVNRS